MRSGLAAGEDRRSFWLDRDDTDGGILLLQIASRAGDRAARADRGNEEVDPAVCVAPDLRSGGLIVGAGVGGIDELAGDKAVGDRAVELLGLFNGSGHALGARGQDELGAERAHQQNPLAGHGIRHHDHQTVAARGRDRGKPDARVAGRGLDDDRALAEQAAFLGVVEHRFADAVLGAAGGVEGFEF